MALNPTHIQPQLDAQSYSEPNTQSTSNPFVTPNQLYIIELALPSGEQTLVKCTVTPFRIGCDPSSTLVLSGAGIEPLHMLIEFMADRVIVQNYSSQNIGYSSAGIYVNGKVYGENQPRMGFKRGFFSLPFGTKTRERKTPIMGKMSTQKKSLNLIISPRNTQNWIVGSTLIFGRHLMTLYKVAQFSDDSTTTSPFDLVEGQILPSVELGNRQFAGLYMRQIFGAWWVFALLFLGGGFFSFTTLQYLIPWLRQFKWLLR